MKPLLLVAAGCLVVPLSYWIPFGPAPALTNTVALVAVSLGCLLAWPRNRVWFGLASAGSLLTLAAAYAVLTSDDGGWRLYGLVAGMQAVIFGCCYGVAVAAGRGSRLSSDAKALAWASLLIHSVFLIFLTVLARGPIGPVEVFDFYLYPALWTPPLLFGFTLFAIVLVRGARLDRPTPTPTSTSTSTPVAG